MIPIVTNGANSRIHQIGVGRDGEGTNGIDHGDEIGS